MGLDSVEYEELLKQLSSYGNIPNNLMSSLSSYVQLLKQSDLENEFSKPMPWIGMYIALASLFCILAMVADLLHGLRNRKLWFPCKYFTLNAASLTVMAVAMKLPVDLNNPMPGVVDQRAKLGSMAFMCTVMANLLPSLATMDGKELVTNMIALGVLVITVVVNVCIEIQTGLISIGNVDLSNTNYAIPSPDFIKSLAAIYVSMLLLLLIVHTCSSFAILKSKQILELKYQEVHQTSLTHQQPGRLSISTLKQYVSKYWIMAETGSPQFLIALSTTTSASGVLCAFSTYLHIGIFFSSFPIQKRYYISDYEWSMIVIFVIQFIGIVLGTIAPVFRCFAFFSLKVSMSLIWNHCKVFKVERYWTQKLYDWKHSSVSSPFRSRKCKIVIENLKVIILSICLVFQKTIVVICKMIALIPIFFVICVWCYSLAVKKLKAMFGASSIVLGQNLEQQEQNKDLHRYALQIQDQMELGDRTLKGISKSVNHLIRKAEKKQPKNLMKLLAESNGFEGVGKYDSQHVPLLISEEYLSCWSLPLVTLTTLALSLPNIQNNTVDKFLSSVSEGLVYVRLVEESINSTDDYVSTRKAAKILWLDVEVYHKWHGYMLRKLAPQLNTAQQILQWFKDTAKNMVVDVESQDSGWLNGNSICKSVSANSMYRITETILLSYDNNTEEVSQEELFVQLSSMIAGTLAACLTNLPRVIMMKCHTSEIEKREANVQVAAQLLGETMQIIDILKERELPSMNPDNLALIDKWWDYYNHPSP